ncbi:unnamed protein product [Arctogadus glacialis]
MGTSTSTGGCCFGDHQHQYRVLVLWGPAPVRDHQYMVPVLWGPPPVRDHHHQYMPAPPHKRHRPTLAPARALLCCCDLPSRHQGSHKTRAPRGTMAAARPAGPTPLDTTAAQCSRIQRATPLIPPRSREQGHTSTG